MADHRATRAGHPDSIVLEPGIQLAAVFMLADEGLEGGAKYIGALPVRFTVMHSCAPHARKSVSLGGLTLRIPILGIPPRCRRERATDDFPFARFVL